MAAINENYLKLQGSYLFQTVARKVHEFELGNPDVRLIKLGIGDVTQPIAPSVLKALHKAVDEMGTQATFRGYAPDLGYDFLRTAIVENDYRKRGIASALTNRLAREVIAREKAPFYCAAWSNVRSVKNALRSGFKPAWSQLTAKSNAFIEGMQADQVRDTPPA